MTRLRSVFRSLLDESITVGIETLVNSADEPATIDSVDLVDADAMSLIEARVVTFPTSRTATHSLEWSLAIHLRTSKGERGRSRPGAR
jgi:hypothetical protein